MKPLEFLHTDLRISQSLIIVIPKYFINGKTGNNLLYSESRLCLFADSPPAAYKQMIAVAMMFITFSTHTHSKSKFVDA
jgi:hypothetical protein